MIDLLIWLIDWLACLSQWSICLFCVVIACLLFVKLVKLDFTDIVFIRFGWRFVEMLSRKRKKREIVNVQFQLVSPAHY